MDIVATPLDPIGGRNKIITVDHYGPASYTTGGEVWPAQSTLGGPNSLGENGVINVIAGSGWTESGNYYVLVITGGKGSLKGSVKLKWIVTSTNVEVNAVTNLSAEHLRLSVLGG